MQYIIVYDITDDNLRSLTAETLKDYGLKRIQKSAFMGALARHSLNSLLTDLRRMVTVDSVIVFPLCDADYRNLIAIGQPFVEAESKDVEFF
ncbi:MAG: CRISPR-associated endonuclease Cas2 [Nitrososphaera sp.]|jgi:CRISPR-associated protein Cas2